MSSKAFNKCTDSQKKWGTFCQWLWRMGSFWVSFLHQQLTYFLKIIIPEFKQVFSWLFWDSVPFWEVLWVGSWLTSSKSWRWEFQHFSFFWYAWSYRFLCLSNGLRISCIHTFWDSHGDSDGITWTDGCGWHAVKCLMVNCKRLP